MGQNPLPSAEKKRTKTSEGDHPIKDALLKPETWKAAMAGLEFILKLVRVGAKVWDMFE